MTKINSSPPIIFLMGPTAAGKTPLAIEIAERFPCDIISVDSAMVYRDMDIGTAKPSADVLQKAPHQLIDLLDPKEIYSAGQFRQDALREIENSLAHNKIPLLVGGTMMYFRVLSQGLALLPPADNAVRDALKARAEKEGWEQLHAELLQIDPKAAERIHPKDSQRIQRALEVYLLTNHTLTHWQKASTHPLAQYRIHSFVVAPSERQRLHARIALRFSEMLEMGFVKEVERLYARGDLCADLPSVRSVGYRQIWDYLSEKISYQKMCEMALAATRQLAKRQLTWLRPWPQAIWFDSEANKLCDSVMQQIDLIQRNE